MTSPKSLVDVCLVGCGQMGRIHAQSLSGSGLLGQLTLADENPETARQLAKDLEARTMSVDMALSCGADAYVIASPPHLHLEHTLKAAGNGGYVFCEKPLASATCDLAADIHNLRKHDGRIQIGFNRRFDPQVSEIKRRLEKNEIGEIEQVHVVSRDHYAPAAASLANAAGLIAETAIHDLDLARFLLGRDIQKVFCIGSALVNSEYLEIGHIDTATIVMSTASGQQVVIQNSLRTAYGYDQRLEVFGSKGRLSMRNPRKDTVELERRDGLVSSTIPDSWNDRYLESYQIEMEKFLSFVMLGGRPNPGLNDGVMASVLADCAQRSLNTGNPVDSACSWAPSL